MSMTFGEFEVSPASLRKVLAAPQEGSKYILLDSIRDSGFLSGNNSGQDFGLGVVDNPLFFFTSYFVPNSPTIPRPYPVKLLWIGSSLGTNDATDKFNINVTDVNPDGFYPGALPSAWLLNPRTVLNVSQAKSDIITWFDANYPGGATGGVGSSNSGSSTTYGTLAGDSSAVGNISGMSSIDGQFWPIYDYVDNTVLLYFSVKTPNANTLSIYCYKLSDTEFGSPATTSEFLGGLYAPAWTRINTYYSGGAILLSSHRFSILSPDPLTVIPRPTGGQSAVFMYSYGVIDGVSPDHGRDVTASIVDDIHAKPLNPGIAKGSRGAITSPLDGEPFYTPDKLGSIFPADSVDAESPGYVCIYNAPLQIDRRPGIDNVVLSAMQLRVMYYHPLTGLSFGSDAINVEHTPQSPGTCRAFFTNYPDGKNKVLYANWSYDNYLNLAYEYLSPIALSPKRQSKILASLDTPSASMMVYTYGKTKLKIKTRINTLTNGLTDNVSIVEVIGGENGDAANGFNFGLVDFTGTRFHQEQSFGGPNTKNSFTQVVVLDPDPVVWLKSVGPGTVPTIYAELTD